MEVAWDGFRDLGVWSREGGDFVCIEPWFDGLSDRFRRRVPRQAWRDADRAGEHRTLSLRIRLC